jgi:secreted trypsin-like serine protease
MRPAILLVVTFFTLQPPRDKIVGGVPARSGQWPWQVALLEVNAEPEADRQFCGASLIAPRWVLTAAHCVAGMTNNQLTVRIGATDLDRVGNGSDTGLRNVARIIRHELYSTSTYTNDIALLELANDASEADGARPVRLPTPPQAATLTRAGAPVTVTGWGLTAEHGEPSSKLLQVEITVIDQAACKADYAPLGATYTVTDRMLCAGIQSKDACQGDSGGPLVAAVDGGYAQVGIVSKGYGCAREGHPGIYTRVASYLDWIAARTAH